jgi:hypothetical protein
MRWWIMLAGVVGCASKDAPAKEGERGPPASGPSRESSEGGASREPSARGGDRAGGAPAPAGNTTKPEPFHEQAEATTAPAEAPRTLALRATWSNIRATDPCWYFSGPAGRDTPLGAHVDVRVAGDHAWLRWGQASFEGTLGASTIDVFRIATHSYQGTWVVSERLRGRVKEQGIHATYTYEECQEGATCPGECRITADVLLVEQP